MPHHSRFHFGHVHRTEVGRRSWLALLLLCTLAPSAHAAWPGDPTVNLPVCTASGDQSGPASIPDGAGGIITAWTDRRSGNYDIYAQRVDSQGMIQWASDGVPVATGADGQFDLSIATDGVGGAIIAFRDQGPVFGSDNIYAQHLDAGGNALWGPQGTLVCGVTGNQQGPRILEDGSGGAYIVWNDFRVNSNSSDSDLYGQRIDGSGALLWQSSGVPICVLPTESGSPLLVSDGAGNVLVAWMDKRNGPFDYDLYAQSVSPSGSSLWAANGVPFCAVPGDAQLFGMVSDGAGGFVAGWLDFRNLATSGLDIFVQRVNNSGTPLWTPNGVAVCTAPFTQTTPTVAPDGTGGAFIAWGDARSGIAYEEDIYAQRVNGVGAPQWAANGIPVCAAPGTQFFLPRAISDGAGGVIIAWPDLRGADSDIYAQRLTGAGGRLWALNGRPISSAPQSQGSISMVPDGAGGAILAFMDGRAVTNADIYAQRVEASGSLSGPLPPTGSIVGRVTASCPVPGTPLAGVTVDAFAVGSGDLMGTGTADASGGYSILDIPSGPYTITLVTPLGYIAGSADISATVPGADTVHVDYSLECVAASGNPNAAGFWKHQFGVATGGSGTGQFGSSALCGFLDMIETHFNNNALNQVVVYDPPDGAICSQKLELAKGLLNLAGSAAPIDKARQQLLSLLLNVAANYLTLHDVITKDGATVSQAVTYCDQIIDNPSGDYNLAASIAEKINSGQKVNAGVIPLGTQIIAYAKTRPSLEFSTGRNPANGPRTFRFSLGAPARVDLSIYDVRGRRVAQVYSGNLPKGLQIVSWSGTDARGERVGRGIYFSKLVVGDDVRVARLVQTSP
jgi:hypothetical protein